jgi:acetyl-CoA synthetase
MPESLSAETREMCLGAGIVPLQGQRQALEALALAAAVGEAWATGAPVGLRVPHFPRNASAKLAHEDGGWAASAQTLSEHEGKLALVEFGVRIPRSTLASPRDAAAAAASIGFPVVMKATSGALEHKSEVGGVIINIRNFGEAIVAADRLARLSDSLLVEEMITDGVAEILIGMTADPQFGQVLVLGAGGVLTELLRDTVTLLPPFTAGVIEAAMKTLSVNKLLTGFRGRPPADVPALVEAALACTRYAEAHVDSLLELDVNPVIVRPAGHGAMAVDALIRLIK